jgi:proline dehydrogenase
MRLLDRLIAMSLPAVPKPIVGYFSRKYIAGVHKDDAFATVTELRDQGAMATLDILGEFISSLDEAETNTDDYCDLVRSIHERGLADTHVSVKLTALGLLLDRDRCLANMRRLMDGIRDTGNFLRIDMEDSPCTDATLEIYETLREEYGEQIGVVLQSRLRRSRDDVARLTAKPTNVRLCKGIYLEPRAIAYTDRVIIQRAFTSLLDQLISNGAYVGIATHDELLVYEALELIHRHGLPRDRYEFQMLLGVEPALRRILIEDGHRLRVYVPFGAQWYAYSVRRLRENPQIAGYAFKAMFRRGDVDGA